MDRHSSDQRADGHASAQNGPGGGAPAGSGNGPREPAAPGKADSSGPARMAQIVAGEYLLTVNPVDGSEIEPPPPGELPGTPRRMMPDERPPRAGAASHLPAPAVPLLERETERDRLRRLLAQGRSVRVTGVSGAGRSRLLDAVAEDVAHLAPDGVIRLDGRHRTSADLLHELFAATHHVPLRRPGPDVLRTALGGVGAIVVLDDLEFGGTQLDELLDATPECAYLLSATPDVAAPAPGSQVEETVLPGISRTACLELLEHAVQRPLTDEEADRSTDLWFTSGGLPLRYVQTGALLRRRSAAHGSGDGDGRPGADAGRADDGGERSAFHPGGIAAQLAAGLTESAREVLRFALALGGELPHHSHLPAVTDDPHASETVAELAAAGLVTEAGAYYRLAASVADQLTAAGYAAGAGARARTVAQHYTWWIGHPSVTSGRVGDEADVVLAAVQAARRGGHPAAAVLAARTAAPVLAAALRWNVWEGVLRSGQEAARASGEIAEEAYFHHELGVLALCTGRPERALAALEASTGLRSALADRRGTIAGRRALTLVSDALEAARGTGPSPEGRSGANGSAGTAATTGDMTVAEAPGPDGVHGTGGAGDGHGATGSGGRAATATVAYGPGRGEATKVAGEAPRGRKSLAAAGAAALLVVVLGAVVMVGNAREGAPSDSVRPQQSASEDESELTADEREGGGPSAPSSPAARQPGQPGPTVEAPPETSAPSSSEPVDDGTSSSPETPGDGSGSGSSEPGGGESSGEGPGDTPSGSTGGTNSGGTDGGSTAGGTEGGTSDGGADGGGSSDGGTSDGGTADGGTSDGGTDGGGSSDGGTSEGGTDGGATEGGSAEGGTGDGGGSGSASPPESSPGTSPSSAQPS